jgi:CheY-like chemotaxis protein
VTGLARAAEIMVNVSLAAVVLLVEDEEFIQTLISEALKDAGYNVVSARDGSDAIVWLDGAHGELSGLVTDIKLFGAVTGWDVATRARELYPDLPIVYMSGDSTVEWASKGVPRSVMLSKPFVPSQVIVALASMANSGDLQN